MGYKVFPSEIGDILLESDGKSLSGIWLFGQKNFARGKAMPKLGGENEVLIAAEDWLKSYFSFNNPSAKKLQIKWIGTDFQVKIWQILQEIPYGELKTYGEIAKIYERETGKRTSARAVGGAVSKNPLLIVVPCHRVVGVGNKLVGFAAGTDIKQKLISIEKMHLN